MEGEGLRLLRKLPIARPDPRDPQKSCGGAGDYDARLNHEICCVWCNIALTYWDRYQRRQTQSPRADGESTLKGSLPNNR